MSVSISTPPRRILAYSSFADSASFEEWQLKNPLCDVMKVEQIPRVGSGIGVFVVWRKYV